MNIANQYPNRRGLRRTAAADYIGVSPSKFDELVHDKRLPKPFKIDGCVIWDVRELDIAFEELRTDGVEETDTWADVR